MAAAAPRISFVSLGCPKALVDSERIITRLRAEGYALARDHAGADLAIVNTCGFLDSAQAESLAAIGEALAINGKVIVTGCMGAEPEKITARYPNVLAVSGPQQYESVIAAVHGAAPPLHDPFLDLVPPQGIKLTPRLLPYLDIPFQHASPDVLKGMRRPAHQEKTLERIARWRAICPDLTIRSTFIVGFPGETTDDFDFLLDWLDAASLDRVGCFRYEPVQGAAANGTAAPVPNEVKEERWHLFMQRQQVISAKRLKRKIGSRQRVIIDAVDGNSAKGRSQADAPEIDGAVHVTSRRPLRIGEIATVKIERADQYDLHGSVVGFLAPKSWHQD